MKNRPQRRTPAATLLLLTLFILSVGISNLWARSTTTGPKVSLLGSPQISTFAGNGTSGFLGDGGAATSAEFNYPYSVAVDGSGNVYIADLENSRVRVVNTGTVAVTIAGVTIGPGDIATVAGTGEFGESGDGGAATSADIGWIQSLAVDTSGNIYLADVGYNVVRIINTSGTISVFAGTVTGDYGCDGENNNQSNGDGGPATSATFTCLVGVSVDSTGNVYLADQDAGLIRQVNTQGIINTVAGNKANQTYCDGESTSSGDGGPALSAVISCPASVRVDASGNLYITDIFASTVRVVNMQTAGITVNGITIQAGNIDHIAGNGTIGYSGDGGPATSAELAYPNDASVDTQGNVYIADTENDVIRKVDTSGNITTYAGVADGWGYAGDGGPATSALLSNPASVVPDATGNVYLADAENSVIRKVSPNGGGTTSDFGSIALGANTTLMVQLYMNQAVTISGLQASGDFSITTAPSNNNRHELASRANATVPKGMPAFLAKRLQKELNQRTYKAIAQDVTLPSCIGTFVQGSVCTAYVQFAPTEPGPRWFQLTATDSTQVNYTFGLTGTGVGSLAAATPGIINTIAGGTAVGALTGMVRDAAGDTYVADYEADVIWKINSQGTVSVFAGTAGQTGYSGDGGPATSALLNEPISVTLDSAGNLYIADRLNNVIRKVDTYGNITTFAGVGTAGYTGDGSLATNAQLDEPVGVLADKSGNLYIGDTFNNVVREVNLSGNISTIAGNGTGAGTGAWDQSGAGGGWSGDTGAATQAELNGPTELALDASGNLYISDTYNFAIRKVDTLGNIWTVAGSCADGCQEGYSGDGGAATSAELSSPFGLAVDAAGDLYVADTDNSAVRRVDVNGVIITVAGGQLSQSNARTRGTNWHSQLKTWAKRKTNSAHPQDASIGDGGIATSAQLGIPVGLAVDNNGSFYLADVELGDVRKIDVTTSDMNFGSLNPGTTSDPLSVSVIDAGNASLNLGQLSLTTAPFAWASASSCSISSPLTAGNSCTLSADVAPTATGNYSGTIVLADDAFNTPQTITMEAVGTQPDYTIGATPTTLTITQGQTGTAMLTVTPQDGYTGTIQFACTGLPAYSTCSFSPASAVITDSNAIPVTVTITTTGTTTTSSLRAPGSHPGPGSGSSLNLWFLPAGLVGVALFGLGEKRKLRYQAVLRMVFAFAVLSGVVVLNGCGGSSTPATQTVTPPAQNVTPVGNYNAMVTTTGSATAGSGQHTAAISITIVQQ